MNIKILDCTLRDGGYINDWNFGAETISSIIAKLNNAKIDIIECGFLTEKAINDDYSLFANVSSVKRMLPQKNCSSMFVAMIAIGEKEIHPDKLEPYTPDAIDGIRLTFHQHETEKAIEWAKIIMSKGYKVFMQPVGTTSYSDSQLLNLIDQINTLNPYAFYIVDTLGSMYRNELFHIFYLINKNLNSNIHIGFHAHNNLQLAFSNAQELSRIHTPRTLILDSSVYGMGRAAGNLPTELITQYLNSNIEKKYDVTTILDIYDMHISLIREKYQWGYEVPYHLAASNVCHPNYASYLINKQTLTMKDIEKIIISIPKEKKAIFDKSLIEQCYMNYQNHKYDDTASKKQICDAISNRTTLVLAPGKSIMSEKQKILSFIEKENPYVISVNFLDDDFPIDACFVSNHKRISAIHTEITNNTPVQLIATSNLIGHAADNSIFVDYFSYTNDSELVFDNVGLMLLKLLKTCHIKKIVLAGFDGFKTRYDENYYKNNLIIQVDEQEMEQKQVQIKNQLKLLSKELQIDFLTHSVYEE